MASIVIMPRQGNTVESCVLVAWRAREGAEVKPEEILCDVETDKAVFEVPAGVGGVVLKLLVSEGDDVPVLQPIAVIGQAGEDWAAALASAGHGAAVSTGSKELPKAAGVEPAEASGIEGAPAAKRPDKLAEHEAFGAAMGSARGVSPRARVLAASRGVDARSLSGTGPGGRVIERDVRAALDGAELGMSQIVPGSTAAAKSASPSAAGRDAFVETPLKGVRKLISERMRASLAGTAQLTFNASANAERLQALRSRFKASDPALGLSDVTVGDLVLYAVSRVLPRFPTANSTLENGVLRTYERVHLALAVDTPRGLMVPVIRDADLLSLRQISSESKRLAAACQAGNINPDELTGGTFTVSNLGALGIESFTPVLNAPQVAILGVDAITQRAAPGPDGQAVFEPRIGLSLTVDHQIIDGVPAARILKGFAEAIADIDLLLFA